MSYTVLSAIKSVLHGTSNIKLDVLCGLNTVYAIISYNVGFTVKIYTIIARSYIAADNVITNYLYLDMFDGNSQPILDIGYAIPAIPIHVRFRPIPIFINSGIGG